MFPVEVCYLKDPAVDYVQMAVDTVFNIHLKVGHGLCPCLTQQEPAGDVLVFLTGRDEIDNAIQQVADRTQS